MSEDLEIENYAPWLAIITFFGGVFRVLLLGTKGMWLDETFSVWIANHSVPEMLQWIIKIDQHPPLYYFLLHYWIGLYGGDAYHGRMLSVLIGTATIPVIFLIGKRLAGGMVGLAAASMLAFSPFNIYYSQETRMYTLLAFNASVAIYALVRLLTDPRAGSPIGSQFRAYVHAWRTLGPPEPSSDGEFSYKLDPRDLTGWRGWIYRHRWLPIQAIETDLAWLGFIVFSAATLYTHNTAVLYILAVNLFVLGLMLFQRIRNSEVAPEKQVAPAFQAPTFWNWVKAQVGILILWAPWISPFIKQASGVYRRFWIPAPTWDSVIQVLKSFINASGPISTTVNSVVWIMAGLALVLALVYFRKKISRLLLLVTLFAVPFLGELIVSIWRPIFWDRTLIWITIPLFLALAAGIAQIKIRPLIFVLLGGLALVNLFSASDYLRYYQKEDWNSAARDIAGYTQKDDLILFNSNFVEIAFNYYFIPYENYYFIQVAKHGLPLDLFESGVLEPVMTTQDIPSLLAVVKGHPRVWLVYSHNTYTDPEGLIPKTLASQMKLIKTDEFNGGLVQLYSNP